ncbi:MAG: hypothetical protein ACLFP1_03965 [Candidatus Goldiibacteriota bacterium]
MRNNFFMFSAIAIFLIMPAFFSCSCSNPQAPDSGPEPTATATPTPEFVTVADFEVENCRTSIVCGGCTNIVGGAMSAGVENLSRNCIDLSGEPAEYGAKAYSISATAEDDGAQWFAVYLNTNSAPDTGSDFSAYKIIYFNCKLETDTLPENTVYTDIKFFTSEAGERLELNDIELDKSGDWAAYSVYLSDFTSAGSLTQAEVLEIVTQVRFYFKTGGDGTASSFKEIILDNITLYAE